MRSAHAGRMLAPLWAEELGANRILPLGRLEDDGTLTEELVDYLGEQFDDAAVPVRAVGSRLNPAPDSPRAKGSGTVGRRGCGSRQLRPARKGL